MTERIIAAISVFLILKKQGQILLSLRQNTGYADGHWAFPAGHVEWGEPATLGMIREAKEELGIEISPEELKVLHVMHGKTNRIDVAIFFECCKWRGEIANQEGRVTLQLHQ